MFLINNGEIVKILLFADMKTRQVSQSVWERHQDVRGLLKAGKHMK